MVSNYEKTDGSTRLKAECFHCFQVFGKPDETRTPSLCNGFSKGPNLITKAQKQKYHLNSQFFSSVSLACVYRGGGYLTNGEAPPRGPTPCHFIYHFGRKGTPFIYFY